MRWIILLLIGGRLISMTMIIIVAGLGGFLLSVGLLKRRRSKSYY